MKRQPSWLWCSLPLLLIAGGCLHFDAPAEMTTPHSYVPVVEEPWTYQNKPGKLIRSPRYEIHTTIADRDFRIAVAQVLEGAYTRYREMTPGVQSSPDTMKCYVFSRREEWNNFTRDKTGRESSVYLQIRRGGYTISDWFAAYDIGRSGTYAVAAHEGWHQYVARHFKGRLPPFLEEGIACMFECVVVDNGMPRWNISFNPYRAVSLRDAMSRGQLWPLDRLVRMNAGDVVNLPTARIEAFYAQNWAFARFLWEGENGRYRPLLQTWLTETANGTLYDPSGMLRAGSNRWSPESVPLIVEHYLQEDIATLQRQYNVFVKQIVRKETGRTIQ